MLTQGETMDTLKAIVEDLNRDLGWTYRVRGSLFSSAASMTLTSIFNEAGDILLLDEGGFPVIWAFPPPANPALLQLVSYIHGESDSFEEAVRLSLESFDIFSLKRSQ